MSNLIPKSRHALIRISKIILEKSEDITHSDVDQVKGVIQNHLDSGLSPSDIKSLYNISYTDFGMFIKKCLGLSLKNSKDAVNNFYKSIGRSITDEKILYKKSCQFSFDPYSITEIPGYDLLMSHGIYHPINNPGGVCRDHMVSVEYGWRNKIDPKIISSPHNCRFLLNIENCTKGEKSSISIDELIYRIHNSEFKININHSISLSKTKQHRDRIAATNRKYMNITDGNKNLRVLKDSVIPENWRRGMTKK